MALESPSNDGRAAGADGPLVLIGGACDPTGEALGAFLKASGALEGKRIVCLTTASSDPVGAARDWMLAFASLGVKNAEIPIVDRRERAQDPEVAEMLSSAGGILLGGGDQVHLVTTLAGSQAWQAIRKAHSEGAVVAGTSAGAAALTQTILAGGEPDEHGKMVDYHHGPGFGLLGFHAVIDTHFTQRRRLQRLFYTIAQNPQILGLGIDEDTALVVEGHLGRVVGKGSMTFVDGRDACFDNAEEALQGRPLTLSYLRVGIVGAGYTFNLRERELEVLVESRERGEPLEVVRGEPADAVQPPHRL